MASDAMKKCYMLSLVGKDQPGIVAKLSAGLCKSGCNLGDSSMARLGGNFTIMVMVEFSGKLTALQKTVKTICEPLGLSSHLVEIEEEPQHQKRDQRTSLSSHADPPAPSDPGQTVMNRRVGINSRCIFVFSS